MPGEHLPSVPDHEWKEFSERAEVELIPTYQEEVRRKLYDLAGYLKTASDGLPNKQIIMQLMEAVAQTLAIEGELNGRTHEQTRDSFFNNLNNALHAWGYTATSERRLESLEDNSRFNKQPAVWLQTREAAKRELERLRPWLDVYGSAHPAGPSILAERAAAMNDADRIYARFPELRPQVPRNSGLLDPE